MEYSDRVDLYIDPTNTSTWVKMGDATNFEGAEVAVDDYQMKYLSGGNTASYPGENFTISPMKFDLSFDPTYTNDLVTDFKAGTIIHYKFDFRNGKAWIGHAYFKSNKPGSVSGDKTNGATMSFTMQDIGDGDWAAGTAVAGNWYDRVTGIFVSGGDFGLSHPSTKTLVCYAVYGNGNTLLVDNSLLTFASSDAGKATVGVNTGVVSTVAVGSTVIKVSVTGKVAVNSSVTCTVS